MDTLGGKEAITFKVRFHEEIGLSIALKKIMHRAFNGRKDLLCGRGNEQGREMRVRHSR